MHLALSLPYYLSEAEALQLLPHIYRISEPVQSWPQVIIKDGQICEWLVFNFTTKQNEGAASQTYFYAELLKQSPLLYREGAAASMLCSWMQGHRDYDVDWVSPSSALLFCYHAVSDCTEVLHSCCFNGSLAQKLRA